MLRTTSFDDQPGILDSHQYPRREQRQVAGLLPSRNSSVRPVGLVLLNAPEFRKISFWIASGKLVPCRLTWTYPETHNSDRSTPL